MAAGSPFQSLTTASTILNGTSQDMSGATALAATMHSGVVVVSGYVAEAFQAAEPLADLYLEKPVNPEELVTIVNELLKSSERATSH